MYDSTLILSQGGNIIHIDADFNDTLFKRDVNYINQHFTALFDTSLQKLLNGFLEQVFITHRLRCIEFFYEGSLYQLKCIIGKPQEAICIISNNTRHRDVLMQLEEHNLNTIVDSYFDSVWSFDTNFTLVTANKAFLEVRHQADNELLKIGDNIFKFAQESAYKKWLPIYRRALKGEIICFEEKRVSHGREYDVEIYITPVYNRPNEIIGCLGVTRDITERKNAQVAIADYARKLEEFAFKTSHELRRPVANIMGIASLLSNELLEEDEKAEAVKFIAPSILEVDSIVIGMIELIQQYKK